MTTILPIASGKGGTGKTLFSVNLGTALALKRKTVILIDLDLGGSNLHTWMGIKNKYPGIGDLIYKRERNLKSLLIETGIERLFLIPGDTLLTGTANLDFSHKKKIIREIKSLIADYIIIDLGSGTSFNTIDFFLASSTGIIITTPETTSLLNAYSFLKSVLYRILYYSFTPRSEERKALSFFIGNPIERKNISIKKIIEILLKINPDSGIKGENQIKQFFPKIVLNMVSNINELPISSKLRQIARKNLGIQMEYIGCLFKSPYVAESLIKRKPLVLLKPESSFAKEINQIANNIIASSVKQSKILFNSDEDIVKITKSIRID